MLTRGCHSDEDATHSPASFPEARQGQCEPIVPPGVILQESYPGEFQWNILGETTSTLVYIKVIHGKNGLQNLLAEGLIFSFARQASTQTLNTILHNAT